MKSNTLASAVRALSLLLLVSGACALAQDRRPVHFSGLINDYSPLTVTLGLVRGYARETTQIDGIELHCPHVEEVVAEVGGDLADDLRFADAARSPDMQGHTLANERMKRFIELRGFHGLSLEV
jgi:hypothetical protein